MKPKTPNQSISFDPPLPRTPSLSDSQSEIIIEYDVNADSLLFITQDAALTYGIPALITGAPQFLADHGVITRKSAAILLAALLEIKSGASSAECTLKMTPESGCTVEILIKFTTVFDAQQQPVRAIGLLTNVLRISNETNENGLLYRTALMKDALLYYEANLTTHKVITGLEKLFLSLHIPYTNDYADSLDLICRHIIHPADQKHMASFLDYHHLLAMHDAGEVKAHIEYRRLSGDNIYRWSRCNVYFVDDATSNCVKSCYYIYDNHEEKLKELELQQKAEQDLLTGLYNKVTTELMIREDLDKHKNGDVLNAFCIVDLDNFKMVNDRLGHAFGDAVLSETAHQLKALCRSEDTVGRIGGDEFALYLKNIKNKAAAENKARDICDIFRNAYPGALQDFSLSGSVGIAFFPDDGCTFEQLYRNADTALYMAKKRGKDSYCFYENSLNLQTITNSSVAAIDSGFRKTFSENISEYVFQIMYEARELQPAVNAVLDLLSRHFGFDRCYVYEVSQLESSCYLTYEWQAPDILPLPDSMHCLHDEALAQCQQRVTTDDFYIYSSMCEQAQEMVFPEQERLHFRFQCALTSYGRFHGFAGFDQSRTGRPFSASELATIRVVAQMLGFFLETQSNEEFLQRVKQALQEVSADMSVFSYTIDPDTYLLTQVQTPVPQIFEQVKEGMYCYQAIRGKDTPCQDCPVKNAEKHGLQTCSLNWELEGRLMKTHFAFIERKDGKKTCVLRCYEMR